MVWGKRLLLVPNTLYFLRDSVTENSTLQGLEGHIDLSYQSSRQLGMTLEPLRIVSREVADLLVSDNHLQKDSQKVFQKGTK